MKGPVTYLARRIAVRKHASTVPTGLLPLSKIRKAAVLLNALDPDLEITKKEVRKFFEPFGIEVLFLAPMKWDVNCFGWLKEKFRCPEGSVRDEDLFISLEADPEYFVAEYELKCSTARFKISRFQLEGNVADISISNPENSIPRSPEAFEVIRDFLLRIR